MALLLARIRRSLIRRPLLTNGIIYMTFYSAAELSQQTYNKYYSPEKPEIDFASATRVIVTGTTVYAPSLYYWYRFLDKTFVGVAPKTIMKKVVLEQFFITPILLFTFYSVLGVLDKKKEIYDNEFRKKYTKSFIANQIFWIPAQTINFIFLPTHMRVVYVAVASLAWINVMCFIKRQKVTNNKE